MGRKRPPLPQSEAQAAQHPASGRRQVWILCTWGAQPAHSYVPGIPLALSPNRATCIQAPAAGQLRGPFGVTLPTLSCPCDSAGFTSWLFLASSSGGLFVRLSPCRVGSA